MKSYLLSIKQSKVSYRKIMLIGLSTSLLISLTIKPVRASITDFLGNNLFGNIISQLSSIFPELSSVTQWVSVLQNVVNDPCQGVPILFATPSEPGWCTSASSILGGNGSISSVLRNVAGVMGG